MNILKHRRKLKRTLAKYKNIFIMGHDGLDLDALGSSIGMYAILTDRKHQCHLIIDEVEHEIGCDKIINEIYGKISLINSREIDQYLGKKNLLLMLDCNKPSLLQAPEILDRFDQIVVIDHHNFPEIQLENALVIVDEEASSTCEMIAEWMYYYGIETKSWVSTLLLSGVVLDTNNFVLRTSSKTYFAAYYLTTIGAEPKKVQFLLKQDIEDYIIRQRVITDVEVLHHTIALAVGSKKVKYKKEELAKIADTLLQFNNIETSYVLGRIEGNKIGLSARSIGTIDVGMIAEQLGGGGSKTDAAAQIEGKTLQEVHEQLLNIFKERGARK